MSELDPEVQRYIGRLHEALNEARKEINSLRIENANLQPAPAGWRQLREGRKYLNEPRMD